jgi:hypothetical protein
MHLCKFKRFLALGMIVVAAGCAPVEQGSHRVQRTAAGIGDRIEAHAVTASQKTRSWWRRIFGGGEEKSGRTSAEDSSGTAKLDTHPQEYVGRSN